MISVMITPMHDQLTVQPKNEGCVVVYKPELRAPAVQILAYSQLYQAGGLTLFDQDVLDALVRIAQGAQS